MNCEGRPHDNSRVLVYHNSTMLDEYHTPIRRLKQAFGLKEKDAEKVVSALFPDEIFPYDVWREAYRHLLQDNVLQKIKACKTELSFSFPTFDPSEHDSPDLQIYSDRIIAYLRDISKVVFAIDIENGLDDITKYIYEKYANEFHAKIKSLLDGLSRIERKFDSPINPMGFTLQPNITSEKFIGLFEKKEFFLKPFNFSFLSKMFIDTISVNKSIAVKHILNWGYSLIREVDGISIEYVNMIKAMPASPHEETSAELTLPFTLEEAPAKPTAPSFIVPRDLWKGKIPQVVIKDMREKEFPDEVIAYVLFNWCDQKNLTQIGKWLGDKPSQVDSTHYRRAIALLNKSEALTIT